jgi:hypothetical protein
MLQVRFPKNKRNAFRGGRRLGPSFEGVPYRMEFILAQRQYLIEAEATDYINFGDTQP